MSKDYPPWFGSPTLIDRIDESVERGWPLDRAIDECVHWAELRGEVIEKLREYYKASTSDADVKP